MRPQAYLNDNRLPNREPLARIYVRLRLNMPARAASVRATIGRGGVLEDINGRVALSWLGCP